MYTEQEIEQVIKNVVGSEAPHIIHIDKFQWKVIFYAHVSLGVISDILEDLNDSDLFDIDYMYHNTYKITFKQSILEFHQWRFVHRLVENNSEKIKFEDSMIKRLTTLWNFQIAKYHSNPFFKSIFDKLVKDKELTQKQYDEFKFLLDNGKSKYEANKLSTKN